MLIRGALLIKDLFNLTVIILHLFESLFHLLSNEKGSISIGGRSRGKQGTQAQKRGLNQQGEDQDRSGHLI